MTYQRQAIYPVADLLWTAHITEDEMRQRIVDAGYLVVPWRGMLNEQHAELASVACGFVPYVVWPEWITNVIVECSVQCQRPDCGAMFVPYRRGQRWCSGLCRRRMANRRAYWRNPQQKNARNRRYYAENRDVLLVKQKRRDDIRRGNRAST